MANKSGTFRARNRKDPVRSDIMNAEERAIWERGATERAKVHFMPPLFPYNQKPNGHLCVDRACHACWYYYIEACRHYQQRQGGAIVVVAASIGPPSALVPINWKQMLIGVAGIYNKLPDEIVKHWPCVDRECLRSGYPLLPATDPLDAPIRFADGPSLVIAPHETPQ